MGKRLNRYFYKDFPTVLESLRNKEVSVVFTNGVSMFGTYLRQEGDKLLVEDKIPRIHYLDIAKIYELVVDSEANY